MTRQKGGADFECKVPLQRQNPPTAKTRIKRPGRKLFEAPRLVEKRKSAGIPCPEEARRIAQGILDRLIGEDRARL